MNRESRREFLARGLGIAGLVAFGARVSWGSEETQADGARMTAKGVEFLRGRQTADGSWSPDRKEPGISALVISGLLRSGRVSPEEPVITKGLGYLEGFLGPDGGLSRASHSSYSTSVALMAFHEANRGGRYDGLIKGGQDFLRSTQFDESNGTSPDNPYYGGAGYGPTPPASATKAARAPRPDLSNTTFMMDALRNTGIPADDPAMKKALVFVSRCQNLKSEFNDQPWADKVNDGGFVYTAAGGGTSVAGQADDGGLRSYASMTYAGLRSMIYAGLSADDPRVKAARAYIARHYSVEENPGLGQRGLYYYYQTFAKTLSVLGEDMFVDGDGKSHDWRGDLTGALGRRQDENGSWVNATDGFMEGDANLVTAYGLLALAHVRSKG
ncbi:prenyltransferase/squalene oxidase repeat-containing protein [Tundrisphaera lichenicola]|uniref:prenyltransferase/squalene oxidase repeat-containing protein n=1 Tax=Tundrisphaera lichenicola TaxID=2029860 RepID=UPI003EBB52E3